MAGLNLFEQATTKATEQIKKAEKAGSQTIEIEGLNEYCMIDRSIKALESLQKTKRGPIDDLIRENCAQQGHRIKRRPPNFKGSENDTVASCEIRKKSSRSVLSDIEIQLLEQHNIPYEVIVDTPECFVFNPNHQAWLETHAQKISAALIKIGAPADIIQKQHAITRKVVGDNTIDHIFEQPIDVIRQLLPVVTTIAIKPTGEFSITKAWDIIKSLFSKKETKK